MYQSLAGLLPVGLFLVFVLVPVFFVERWRDYRAKTRRSPLAAQLLRSPGESLLKELDGVRMELVLWLTVMPAFALMAFGMHLSVSYLAGLPETSFRQGLTTVAILVALGLGFYKVFALERRRVRLKLGYEGEVAVAQELNQLMRQGTALFHDVPGEGFNIDHVLVGKYGVYAIETKSRLKPKRDKGKDDAKVVFDGDCLAFPTWKETAPLEQAAYQAKWLSKWLSSAVGENIVVRPALALPGWYVERTGRSEVAVFNPRNASFLAKGWLKEPLSEGQIQRIEHQLDQRCRDVEPHLFGKKGMKSQTVTA